MAFRDMTLVPYTCILSVSTAGNSVYSGGTGFDCRFTLFYCMDFVVNLAHSAYLRVGLARFLVDHRINLLTPNVNYSGRIAPLTYIVAFYIFIQQIQVLYILNIVYTLRFFLFKMQFIS